MNLAAKCERDYEWLSAAGHYGKETVKRYVDQRVMKNREK